MFWDTAKSVGGFIAGVAATRVTTLAIEELTKCRIGVFIPLGDSRGSELHGMVPLAIKHSRAEKVVLAVGTMVISAAIGAAVGNYARREIGELEGIIKELSDDIKQTVDGATYGNA